MRSCSASVSVRIGGSAATFVASCPSHCSRSLYPNYSSAYSRRMQFRTENSAGSSRRLALIGAKILAGATWDNN